MMSSRSISAAAAVLLLFVVFAAADEYSHSYQPGEEVLVWVNKVGPHHNPQETYGYYQLPFCKSPNIDFSKHHKFHSLGEVLEGNELTPSGIEIQFGENRETTTICELILDAEKAKEFQYAVENSYWYQMYIDDLPVWGMVGDLLQNQNSESKTPVIFTHKKLEILYNQDKIIEVYLTSQNPQVIIPGATIAFTYSVTWHYTSHSFENRFDRYLDENFFEHQIHWFSIFNSFMMVIFLCGLVSLILMRALRNDYAKYTAEGDDIDIERVVEESGWKQIHGDVFRKPAHVVLFSALVGTGFQMLVLIFGVTMFAVIGAFYSGRGNTTTTFILCYALTSFLAGYVSGGLYKRLGGDNWIKTMMVTSALFPWTCFSIAFVLNFIAIYYNSLAAIPFGTMVLMVLIWGFVSFPLTMVGTVVGKNWDGEPNNPCRVNKIARPIPEGRWFTQPYFVALVGGVLPFGSIFIEMYFIFTSFWNYKFYYVYGFMLLVYAILIIVSVCVTIVSTYFLLNSEDYRWHWTSFFCSASTAAYVFLYSAYYFFTKTKMSGFFQTCYYFGYMAMFCLGLGLVCGSVGYLGTSLFVRRIYRNIKSD